MGPIVIIELREVQMEWEDNKMVNTLIEIFMNDGNFVDSEQKPIFPNPVGRPMVIKVDFEKRKPSKEDLKWCPQGANAYCLGNSQSEKDSLCRYVAYCPIQCYFISGRGN